MYVYGNSISETKKSGQASPRKELCRCKNKFRSLQIVVILITVLIIRIVYIIGYNHKEGVCVLSGYQLSLLLCFL